MLNAAAITAALAGLVGFRPLVEGNQAGPLHLPDELTSSTSGLYVQDVSELLVSEVLQALVPRTVGAATWLSRLKQDALSRFTASLVAAQGLAAPVLLPQVSLVKNPGQRSNVVNKSGRFVGIQLRALARRGATFSLPAISFQFDGVLGLELPVYVYVDSQPAPLNVYAVDTTDQQANFPFQVSFASLDLTAAAQVSSTVWVGYYEDDLPLGVHAIYSEVGPCGCINDPFMQWSQYVGAAGFSVAADKLADDRSLFDPINVVRESGNFGLNLTFLSACDIASALASDDNILRLGPLVQQALAIRLYEAIASTTNVTQVTGSQDTQADAINALNLAQAKLYGGTDPATKLTYSSALAALALDFSGLDVKCQKQTPSLLSVGRLVR